MMDVTSEEQYDALNYLCKLRVSLKITKLFKIHNLWLQPGSFICMLSMKAGTIYLSGCTKQGYGFTADLSIDQAWKLLECCTRAR